MERKETPEEFRERMRRQSREAQEEIAKMSPEERAEFMEAARGHTAKVHDQMIASYEADVREWRIRPPTN